MRLNKTAVTGAFGVLSGAALLAGPAFACSPNARIQTSVGIGGAGTEVAVNGEEFIDGSTVEVRWDTEDGVLLGSSVAGPSFATRVQVPANATPGFHYVVAVQRAGFRVTRALTFEVVAPATTPAPVPPNPVTPVPPTPVTPTPVTPVTPAPVTPTPVTPVPVAADPGAGVLAEPVDEGLVSPTPLTPDPVTPGPVTPGPVLTPGPLTPGPLTSGPLTLAPVAPGAPVGTPVPLPATGVVTPPRGSARPSGPGAVVGGPVGFVRALVRPDAPVPGTTAGQQVGSPAAPSAAAVDPATFWGPQPSVNAPSGDDLWKGLDAPPSLLSPGPAPGRDTQTTVAAGLMGIGLVALAATAGASAWRRLAYSRARTRRT